MTEPSLDETVPQYTSSEAPIHPEDMNPQKALHYWGEAISQLGLVWQDSKRFELKPFFKNLIHSNVHLVSKESSPPGENRPVHEQISAPRVLYNIIEKITTDHSLVLPIIINNPNSQQHLVNDVMQHHEHIDPNFFHSTQKLKDSTNQQADPSGKEFITNASFALFVGPTKSLDNPQLEFNAGDPPDSPSIQFNGKPQEEIIWVTPQNKQTRRDLLFAIQAFTNHAQNDLMAERNPVHELKPVEQPV